jgi:hypothetical protein
VGKAEPEVGTVLAIGLPGGGGAAVLTGRAIFAQRVRCWLGPALVLSAAISFALTLLSCVALFGAWGGATLLTAHNRAKRCFGDARARALLGFAGRRAYSTSVYCGPTQCVLSRATYSGRGGFEIYLTPAEKASQQTQ